MKQFNSLSTIALIFIFSTVSAQLSEGPFEQLIIRGVTLINGNGAPPIGPVDVVVEKNIIREVSVVGYPGVEIDPEKRPELRNGGKEIDAHGMYLLPGFIDMHGHIGGVAQGADWDYVFNLWLAHGITTAREPSGRGRDWTLDLKKRSEKTKLLHQELSNTPGLDKVQNMRFPLLSRQERGFVKMQKLDLTELNFLELHLR